ncbi:MAG: shikimate dehydrogenase [Brevinematales bacterium]|nr:shikimate dehydrogenase [Brevinematales bacterium]
MINALTQTYCIIGNPVRHSFSPIMQNKAFEEAGLNSVYTAFEVTDLEGAVNGIRALGIHGASVTIPHKIDVMQYLDDIEDIAAMIGSVNTVVNRDGRLSGTNTDAYGFYRALAEADDVDGKQIALLGSGGAARAIAFALFYFGKPAKLEIAVRNEDIDAAHQLRKSLIAHLALPEESVEVVPLVKWNDIGDSIEIIINTTPLGMHPNTEVSPLEKEQIRKGITVMDIVYHPRDTLLLRYAGERDCRIVSGIDMLLYQGVKQFELWTGVDAPENVMRDALMRHLQKSH